MFIGAHCYHYDFIISLLFVIILRKATVEICIIRRPIRKDQSDFFFNLHFICFDGFFACVQYEVIDCIVLSFACSIFRLFGST